MKLKHFAVGMALMMLSVVFGANSAIGAASSSPGQPELKVDISGLDEPVTVTVRTIESLMRRPLEGDETIIKVTPVTDKLKPDFGKFNLDLDIKEPTQITLVSPNMNYQDWTGKMVTARSKVVTLYLNKGEKAVVKGELKDGKMNYAITGTKLNKELTALRNKILPALWKVDSLNAAHGEAGRTANLTAFGELNQTTRTAAAELRTAMLDELTNNLNTEASGYIMTLYPRDIEKVYDKMPAKLREGMFKDLIAWGRDVTLRAEEQKKAKEAISNGNKAPDFMLKTPDGKDLSLSDLKGKYVVIDFWGSWCGFCIMGFPDMKEYYAKYKDKVEFLGVACSDTQAAWLAKLEEHQLPWPQVIDRKDVDVPTMYAIEGYPTKIILDPNQNIVGVFRGEGEAFYNKLDELFR